MGNLTTAMVFVLTLNVLMFLTQATILQLNPDAGQNSFFSNQNQILYDYDKNKGVGDPVLDTANTYDNLPSSEQGISPDNNNPFTDVFKSAKNWLSEKTGAKYLGQIVSAPYNMLKAMNLPNAFSFAIGTLWYGVTLFLIIAFIFGRDI